MPNEDVGSVTKPTNLSEDTLIYRMVRKAHIEESGMPNASAFVRRIPEPERDVKGDPSGLSMELTSKRSEDATVNSVFEHWKNTCGAVCRLSVGDVHQVALVTHWGLTVYQTSERHANILGLPYPVDIEVMGKDLVGKAEFLGGELALLAKPIKYNAKHFPQFSPLWGNPVASSTNRSPADSR